MTRYKLADGKRIQFTAEEEAARDAEEKAWADDAPNRRMTELRRQRNVLLAETDWMANSDVTMPDAWKKYRQELRDITKTFKSMDDKGFAFPTKPTE
tara:strand:- start:330 stop:620 length:291 start_codon:yes stop_codon:yes gene_type:complete